VELSIAHVVQGSADKSLAFDTLIASLALKPEECAFVGDDLPDLAVMRRCGLAVAVANAVEAVKASAHYVTRAAGGRGAVREFCELVLRAQGNLAAHGAP
jgi:3-deoxy-D-manno-octulosonate 8-phosphate phosphatase (KDO 8-P phosphatase)